jgi:uncharacterized caspase-like protein
MFRSTCFTISALLGLTILLPHTSAAASGHRVALVIGNGHYQSIDPLPNPRNDARDMAEKLKGLGFDVLLDLDATKQTFQRDLAQFARLARDSDAAIFYYAGHAMQYSGSNYFMPVDAQLQDEYSLASDMVGFDSAMTSLDAARGVKMLVVDACRNNPLAERLQTASRGVGGTSGLATVQASYGTLVAYATQANKVAADGEGRNSPFTAALLDQIGAPGVEVVSTFRRVIEEVYKNTDKKQLPEVSVQLVGEFYFNPGPAPPPTSAETNAVVTLPAASQAPPANQAAVVSTRLALVPPDATSDPKGMASVNNDSALARSVQNEMSRLGCYAGPADSNWASPMMQQALKGLAHFAKIAEAPKFPTVALLEDLKKRDGRLCPVLCSPKEELRDDTCVAKTCPQGQRLTDGGACATQPVARLIQDPKAFPAHRQSAPKPTGTTMQAHRSTVDQFTPSSAVSSRFRQQACLLDKRYCN